jgi:hypothetical protein
MACGRSAAATSWSATLAARARCSSRSARSTAACGRGASASSNVGYVDAEIVNQRFRGVPVLVIAPPASLRFGSLLRWMLPRLDAAQFLIDTGYASASRALARREVQARNDGAGATRKGQAPAMGYGVDGVPPSRDGGTLR